MRIQIIGASGTGKSTLGAYLSDMLRIPLLESDRYLWEDSDFRFMRPEKQRREMLRRDLKAYPDFVFSGSVHSWDKTALKDIDLLALLTLDDEARMARLSSREEACFGARCREGGDHYEETCEFLSWAKTYMTEDEFAVNSLAAHTRLVREAVCPSLLLDSSKPVRELAEMIVRELQKHVPIC